MEINRDTDGFVLAGLAGSLRRVHLRFYQNGVGLALGNRCHGLHQVAVLGPEQLGDAPAHGHLARSVQEHLSGLVQFRDREIRVRQQHTLVNTVELGRE